MSPDKTFRDPLKEQCAKRGNFRIRVIPVLADLVWVNTSDQKHCADIAKSIRRHVDHIESVDVQSDIVCKFCGYEWETDSSGEPQCCTAAAGVFASMVKPKTSDAPAT